MFRRFRGEVGTQTRSPAAQGGEPASLHSPPARAEDGEPEGEEVLGLKLLVAGDDPITDIVAVHGLDGHREKTWTADNKVMWLRTLLPLEIPHARIFTYGFDSRTHSSEHLTRQTLFGHSVTLVSALSLCRRRTKTERRPIIFVAHSLGGIVVKSALIHSNMATVSHNEHLKAIKLSTYGIIFFGTPHQGANYTSWSKLLVNVASIFQQTNTDHLRHLEKDSHWLETQLEQYKPISADIFTIFCYESYPTPLKTGISAIIVPKSSAVVPGMINAEAVEIKKSHIAMVKFQNALEDDFQTVVGHMHLMCEKVEEKIIENWARWDEIKG
ncbi:MAG: hypothetical protein M1840_001757 [Geoglossum simile]|nr:MAG: hypothetical protein M1840_001757 [Geoglossum simile]